MSFKKRYLIQGLVLALGTPGLAQAHDSADSEIPDRIIEIKAANSSERSRLANLGFALEDIRSDRVFVWGHEADAAKIRAAGFEATSTELPSRLMAGKLAEPVKRYHTYETLTQALQQLEHDYPSLVSLSSMGRSVQNRDIPVMRISGVSLGQAEAQKTPVMFYMGCHHAREHLSVEVPLMFAQYLLSEYGKNPDVTRLVNSREIFVAPMINPDGHTYDFTGNARGRMWRKNRSANADGTFGVDLNRNYGYGWGTGGSSDDPRAETYKGTAPFSEPETQAVRDFIVTHPRMTSLLTFHTFSELILYPWGGSKDKVGQNGKGTYLDGQTFSTMAQAMAQWNNYTPEQASDLYIASGDTTDWAYGERGIIAFTFELTPRSMQEGGFYPGDKVVDPTFAENIKPMMYMLEYADKPSRVLSEKKPPSFLTTPASRGIPVADYRDTFR